MYFVIKHFKELSINELYEIVKSRFEVFVSEQKIVEQDFDDVDKESYHLFAIKDKRVIAYCRVITLSKEYNTPSIGRVLVLKEYRRKKLAFNIMTEAISFIKHNLKKEEVTLSAQEYIVDFYKSLGFVEASNKYIEAGIPHIKMKLKLLI